MKRSPIKRKSRLRPVSRKRAAYRASEAGQAALAYMDAVKRLPCAVCGAAPPSDAHHCYHDRYGTGKSSDWDVIPLCKPCHQTGPLSVHNAKEQWHEMHGPDHSYIPQTADLVLAMFGIKRRG